jgi:hypothetical protein
VAAQFVRARNESLGVEKVLPASALPYLAGWRAIDPAPEAEPAPDMAEATADPAPDDEPVADATAPAAEPVTPGSTPVGRPTRKPKES